MAITVQMQFESAVTEMYQDAFVGLHKDSCKSGHRTWRKVLSHIIRAVFGGDNPPYDCKWHHEVALISIDL